MKSKILLVLSILTGLMFINGGLDKFLHYMPMPEKVSDEMMKDGMAMMEIVWLMPLVGAAEILGGLLLLFPKTRALGALVLFPLMVGITLTNIFAAPDGLPIVAVIWAILIWVMIDSKHKYEALFR